MALKRSILFIAVTLLVGPFIYLVVSTLCVGAEMLITVPMTTSLEKFAANLPLALAAMAFIVVIAAIAGSVLVSPITFSVGVTLAIVDGYDLAKLASNKLNISERIASDVIGFFVGGFAAALPLVFSQDFRAMGGFELMSQFPLQPDVLVPTIGFLPMSVFCGGIAAAACNRIAMALGQPQT